MYRIKTQTPFESMDVRQDYRKLSYRKLATEVACFFHLQSLSDGDFFILGIMDRKRVISSLLLSIQKKGFLQHYDIFLS